jgi:hypothetical protein
VTIVLTKSGPPEELRWRSPEQIAMTGLAAGEQHSAVVVPAGKTADVGPISGRFAPGVTAVVRVYLGEVSFDQMLATQIDTPLRHDVYLNAPVSKLIVSTEPTLSVRNLNPTP